MRVSSMPMSRMASCLKLLGRQNHKLVGSLKTAPIFRLMNEQYFVSRFEQFERDNCWDELFHKINIWSGEQEKNLSLTYDVSNCFDNMEKNRYRNVLPYDQNRVLLRETGKDRTDYINASPLHIPLTRQNYILTQGPLATTMVFEQDSQIVIMLSKIMEKNFIKCHCYFPCKEEPLAKFDFFECELLNEEVKPHYICREIRLSPLENKAKESVNLSSSSTCEQPKDSSTSISQPQLQIVQEKSRIIQHFQFTTWPDFGVPEHTDHFLEFLQHVRSTSKMSGDDRTGSSNSFNENTPRTTRLPAGPSPIVCHCSAGIGRTGTFVVVDSILTVLGQKRQSGENEAQSSDSGVSATTTITAEIEANHDSENKSDISAVEQSKETMEGTTTKSSAEETIDSSETKDGKAKRKKIKQRAEPILQQKQSPRQVEPLDEISDLVVFMRKSRMGGFFY